VGNCFLRISEAAGNFPTEISSGKASNIRRSVLVRVGEIPLPVNVSGECSASNSAVNSAGSTAAKLFPQVIPQETEPIPRKIRRKFTISFKQFCKYFLLMNANGRIKSHF
jgi:hypothetical protein